MKILELMEEQIADIKTAVTNHYARFKLVQETDGKRIEARKSASEFNIWKKQLVNEIGQYSKNPNDKSGISTLEDDLQIELLSNCTNTPSTENRTKFIEYVATHLSDPENYALTANQNQVISFKDTLGIEGLNLYKKALKEEAESHQFIYAVVNASTTIIKGKKVDPMVIILSGPSSTGKSSIANKIVEKIFKSDQEQHENVIIAIDGGITRLESQMRKLACRVNVELGYGGISDLENQSGALKKVTGTIRNVIARSSKISLMIPETFSSHAFQRVLKDSFKELLDAVDQSKRPVIFASMTASSSFANPWEELQKVAKFLSGTRAWYTKKDRPSFNSFISQDRHLKNQLIFDTYTLNDKKDLQESKKPTPFGFWPGKIGSDFALEDVKNRYGRALCIEVKNDLILLKGTEGSYVVSDSQLRLHYPNQKSFTEDELMRLVEISKTKELELVFSDNLSTLLKEETPEILAEPVIHSTEMPLQPAQFPTELNVTQASLNEENAELANREDEVSVPHEESSQIVEVVNEEAPLPSTEELSTATNEEQKNQPKEETPEILAEPIIHSTEMPLQPAQFPTELNVTQASLNEENAELANREDEVSVQHEESLQIIEVVNEEAPLPSTEELSTATNEEQKNQPNETKTPLTTESKTDSGKLPNQSYWLFALLSEYSTKIFAFITKIYNSIWSPAASEPLNQPVPENKPAEPENKKESNKSSLTIMQQMSGNSLSDNRASSTQKVMLQKENAPPNTASETTREEEEAQDAQDALETKRGPIRRSM